MILTDILDELGIEREESRPGWNNINCPYCGVPGKPGLGIHNNNCHTASCWKCGIHPLVEALSELSGEPWRKIKGMLGNVEETEKTEKPRGRLILPHGIQELARSHKQYLRHRDLSSSFLERFWKIQGIGIAARLSWRIFIPIQLYGRTVSWTTRSISHTNPARYIAARADEESVPAKSLLFGLDMARHSIIVCEGPFDVFRVGPGSVCTFGVQYTKCQVAKIASYPVRTIVFDSDVAAQEQARKLCDELSVFPGKTYRVEIDAKDPGSASRKEIRQLRKLLK